jgi:hypothetical protein
MRAVTLGVSAVALCLAGGLGVLHAADPRPITFAVLRGDGILIPFATRAGDKWSLTWPVPVKAIDIPIDVGGIPKRWWGKAGPVTTWHAWTIDGTATEVRVERPAWYPARCQQGIGLKTSLAARPPVPPPTVQPYPKLGLAATARLPFKAIEALDEKTAPSWDAIAASVATELSKAEDNMRRTPVEWGNGGGMPHPFPPEERAKVPARLESLYRIPLGDGRTLHFFEVVKRYGMPPLAAGARSPAPTTKDGCGLMTFGRGWLVMEPDGRFEAPEVIAYVTSCDYGPMSLMLPLGYVDDPDGALWFAQYSSWEAEAYAVLRADKATGIPEALFTTHGGVCPAPGTGW